MADLKDGQELDTVSKHKIKVGVNKVRRSEGPGFEGGAEKFSFKSGAENLDARTVHTRTHIQTPDPPGCRHHHQGRH